MYTKETWQRRAIYNCSREYACVVMYMLGPNLHIYVAVCINCTYTSIYMRIVSIENKHVR